MLHACTEEHLRSCWGACLALCYFTPFIGGGCMQQRFIARLSGFLSGPMVTKGIQGRWMTYLTAMDKGLGAAVCSIACKPLRTLEILILKLLTETPCLLIA